ncbi:hypothetical protein [Fluviicola sp.]|uniref:hypothetical protein n=1 Tax=Fluviicola sp. TaxID=1917219 RepID=UPI0031DF4066
MKKSISIFESHDQAVKALETLRESGIDMSKVSLVGHAEVVDDHLHVKSNTALVATPVAAGTVLGTTLGVLTGVGLFAIPGLGILFGAGAVVGALAGFQVGVLTGGFASILVDLGVKDDHVEYEQHLKEGRFLLFYDGTDAEIDHIEHIIEGRHLGVARH